MSSDPSGSQYSSYYPTSTGRQTQSTSRRNSQYTQSTSPLPSLVSSRSSQSYDRSSYYGITPGSSSDFVDSFDDSGFAQHSFGHDAYQLQDLIKEITEDAERVARSHRNGDYYPVYCQPDTARASSQRSSQWQQGYIHPSILSESAVSHDLLQEVDAPPVTDRLLRVNGASSSRYRQLAPMPREGDTNFRQTPGSGDDIVGPFEDPQRLQVPGPSVSRRPRAQVLFECGACGQTLGRESDLDRHILTMHGNTYYRCQGPDCLHQCRRRDRMVAQIRNKHRRNPCGYREMYRDA